MNAEKLMTELPNIGPAIAAKLQSAGITTHRELKLKGSVATLRLIQEELNEGCYNMLYALEGAIRGIRWHDIPKEDRETLKAELQKLF